MKRILYFVAALFFTPSAYSQYSILATGAGSTYTQDFNSFAGTALTVPTNWSWSWTDFTPGGYYNRSSAYVNSNSTYALRESASPGTDIAFGAKQDNANYTLTFSAVNNSGSTIDGFVVTWNVEQYSASTNATPVNFSYRLNAASFGTTGVTGTTLTSASTGAGVNLGSITSTSRSITITGLSLAVGGTVDFRFTFGNSTSNNAHIGVDDFTMYATTGGATPVDYYSSSSGNLDDVATWNTNTSGTGGTALAAGGFTAGNVILNLRNGNPGTITGSSWTVSGTGSKIVIDGTDLTIPATKTISATIDVNASRTLKIQTATLPTFGTLAVGSTIEFNQSTAFTVPNTITYQNLTLSGAGTKSFDGNTTTVSGNLVFDGLNSGSLTLNAPSSNPFATITLTGNLTYLGTVVNPADANSITLTSTSATTQTITANGNTVRFFRINSGSTGNNIILSSVGGNSNALLGNASTSGGLTLSTGTIFDLNGNTLTFFGNGSSISGAGTIKGSSTSSIIANRSSNGSFGTLNFEPSFNNLNNLTINHTGTTPTVALGSALNIYGTVTVTAGTLALGNNNLTLISNASGTASIGSSAATTPFTYGTGNIVAQKYIAGGGMSNDPQSKRAYRFLAHPFSSSIALNQLQTAIDITGTGTGFDASASNAPSAFSWNQATANGASNDAGWAAVTNTTTSSWAQYQSMRVFYRGTKGTGLTSTPYTVGAATLSMSGTVNTGNQTINLTYPNLGTTTNFNFVGNPYASNVQMSGVTNANTASAYYVWNLALGTRGAYTTVTFSSPYVLPAYAGFFVAANAASPSLVFHEADKTANAATDVLLRNNGSNQMNIRLKSGSIIWDELQMESNKNATAAIEYADAKKLLNPDVSFYAISSDNNALAIDKRNIQAGDIIPLGLTTMTSKTFTMEFNHLDIKNVELYLHDKYMNVLQKLETGGTYDFATDANPASQGDNRFELVAKQLPVVPVVIAPTFYVKLSPNPASDMVKVSFSNAEQANTIVSIANAEGKLVKKVDAGNVQSGQMNIPVKGLAKGIYYITLNNGTERKTEKLQIQ